MTMHLEGPWLSTTGKKKGKKKFVSAEHARKARELAEEWERKKLEWEKPVFGKKFGSPTKIVKNNILNSGPPPGRDYGPKIASKPDTVLGPVAKKPNPCYTGTKILGIGTMHKSNAIPIFSSEEAEAVAHMRR